MTNSVHLYLGLGVSDGIGFWLVNFTEEADIFNSIEDYIKWNVSYNRKSGPYVSG